METGDLGNPICSTLDCLAAACQFWDVVIVGAGPTGSLAAQQLALTGAKVLLVDRLSFPRWKICGCCLNGRAVSILKQTGVLKKVYDAGAISLTNFELRAGQQSLKLSLPSSLSLSRNRLDTLLVRSAIAAGADFLPETEARLGSLDSNSGKSDSREVILAQGTESVSISAKVVLVCEGLNQRLLNRANEFISEVDEHSCIGAGAVASLEQGGVKEGTIFMAVGQAGYVGAVMVEDGLLNFAAALKPRFLKEGERLGTLAHQILQEAGFTFPVDVEQLNWQGTVKLTRKISPVAADRLLVLGDASGYVEPFTGEGMGWGLSSAVACVPVVLAGLNHWNESLTENWKQYHRQQVQRRQKWCQRCACALKCPLLVKRLISVIKYCPWIVSPIIRHFNRP